MFPYGILLSTTWKIITIFLSRLAFLHYLWPHVSLSDNPLSLFTIPTLIQFHICCLFLCCVMLDLLHYSLCFVIIWIETCMIMLVEVIFFGTGCTWFFFFPFQNTSNLVICNKSHVLLRSIILLSGFMTLWHNIICSEVSFCSAEGNSICSIFSVQMFAALCIW